jgi:hypothetical protein
MYPKTQIEKVIEMTPYSLVIGSIIYIMLYTKLDV